MVYFKFDALRTISSVSNSSRCETEAEGSPGSDPFFFVCSSGSSSVRSYRSSSEPSPVKRMRDFPDVFYPTSAFSYDPEYSFSTGAHNFGPNHNALRLARTVSAQARDYSFEDLIPDEIQISDSGFGTDWSFGYSRALSDTSTASELPKRQKVSDDVPANEFTRTRPNVDVPKLHLGENGRSKLKSLISGALKRNIELKRLVASVGKVKLASVSQLLEMAFLCGLGDEVIRISESSTVKRF